MLNRYDASLCCAVAAQRYATAVRCYTVPKPYSAILRHGSAEHYIAITSGRITPPLRSSTVPALYHAKPQQRITLPERNIAKQRHHRDYAASAATS